MRVYLDACCLNRPFDDQTQERIRLEAEAVTLFIQLARQGKHEWVSSEIVEEEIRRCPDANRRSSVLAFLLFPHERLALTEPMIQLAEEFVRHGIHSMDAMHLAAR
mgnify:FL=1